MTSSMALRLMEQQKQQQQVLLDDLVSSTNSLHNDQKQIRKMLQVFPEWNASQGTTTFIIPAAYKLPDTEPGLQQVHCLNHQQRPEDQDGQFNNHWSPQVVQGLIGPAGLVFLDFTASSPSSAALGMVSSLINCPAAAEKAGKILGGNSSPRVSRAKVALRTPLGNLQTLPIYDDGLPHEQENSVWSLIALEKLMIGIRGEENIGQKYQGCLCPDKGQEGQKAESNCHWLRLEKGDAVFLHPDAMQGTGVQIRNIDDKGQNHSEGQAGTRQRLQAVCALYTSPPNNKTLQQPSEGHHYSLQQKVKKPRLKANL